MDKMTFTITPPDVNGWWFVTMKGRGSGQEMKCGFSTLDKALKAITEYAHACEVEANRALNRALAGY